MESDHAIANNELIEMRRARARARARARFKVRVAQCTAQYASPARAPPLPPLLTLHPRTLHCAPGLALPHDPKSRAPAVLGTPATSHTGQAACPPTPLPHAPPAVPQPNPKPAPHLAARNKSRRAPTAGLAPRATAPAVTAARAAAPSRPSTTNPNPNPSPNPNLGPNPNPSPSPSPIPNPIPDPHPDPNPNPNRRAGLRLRARVWWHHRSVLAPVQKLRPRLA